MSLKVFVQSPDTFGERRFDPEITIEALKHKLEGITGISFRNQRLVLYQDVDSAEALGQPVCVMDDEQGTLSRYGVEEYQCIKVENTDPNAREGGEFTDVSQVEKFELTREEYESRSDTVLNALKARSLGRFAPSSTTTSSTIHTHTPDQVIGARCLVSTDGATNAEVEKRGTIRFVGETGFGDGKGEWIGIELDEPVGKNDGSVNGQRYFTCGSKRGVFVRPNKVQVGDYPEVDEFADSEDEV